MDELRKRKFVASCFPSTSSLIFYFLQWVRKKIHGPKFKGAFLSYAFDLDILLLDNSWNYWGWRCISNYLIFRGFWAYWNIEFLNRFRRIFNTYWIYLFNVLPVYEPCHFKCLGFTAKKARLWKWKTWSILGSKTNRKDSHQGKCSWTIKLKLLLNETLMVYNRGHQHK